MFPWASPVDLHCRCVKQGIIEAVRCACRRTKRTAFNPYTSEATMVIIGFRKNALTVLYRDRAGRCVGRPWSLFPMVWMPHYMPLMHFILGVFFWIYLGATYKSLALSPVGFHGPWKCSVYPISFFADAMRRGKTDPRKCSNHFCFRPFAGFI